MENLVKCYIPGEGGFCGTFASDSEDAARKMAEVHGLTIKPFAVRLKQVYPSPLVWEKVDGWSTWKTED